jgi:hypothetical protein
VVAARRSVGGGVVASGSGGKKGGCCCCVMVVFSLFRLPFFSRFLCFCFCPSSSLASAFIPCCFVLFFSFPLYFPSFFLSNFYIYFALYFSFSLLSFSICFLFSSSLIL